MLANHIRDLGLGAVVERVIGGAHVGELGVAAPGRQHSPRQQRILRRDRPERAVGVPQPVAELEKPYPVLGRDDRAVPGQVGQIGNAGAEPVVFAFPNASRCFVIFQVTKIPGKCDLLRVADVLVAEDEHPVPVHARFDRGPVFAADRLRQVDARNLAGKGGMKPGDG